MSLRTASASLAAVLSVGSTAHAMDIAVVGSWTTTVTASDLTAGAGSDLAGTHTSASSQATLDVSNVPGGPTDTWRVDVSRSDAIWSSSIHVWARRTGDGTGSGSISGGGAWQELGTTDATFFSGAGDRSGVTIQLRVTGLTVGIPANVWATSIVYTLVDT